MRPFQRLVGLAASALLAASATGSAGDEEPAEPQIEQVRDVPAGRKAFYDTPAKETVPRVQWVTFFRPGTNEVLDSVPAGQRFDVEILLDRRATSDVQVTVTAFRLDAAGLGSGDVKVIPIVVGSGPGERYWAIQPPSPVTIRNGSFGVRIQNAGKVLADAQQPPGGNITMPFVPVKFPDHVILFVKHGESLLAPTLRIAKP